MWCTLATLACALALVSGHGRIADPPNRASLWRAGYSAPANYDDDGLNCGGFYHQWEVNGGKCGICGDAYELPTPRAHELGGTFGLGTIVANYQVGDIVPFTIYLSASHLGFWEFRISSDPNCNEQECFDTLVELEDGETKYYPLKGSGTYVVNYRIPDVSCDHCVLQWKYTAGNNWGVCEDGRGALGCGNQENFLSCADISISGSVNVAETNTFIPVANAESNVVVNEGIPSPLQYYLANGILDTKGLLHLLLNDERLRISHRTKQHPTKYSNKHKRRRRINDKKPKRKKVTHDDDYKKLYY